MHKSPLPRLAILLLSMLVSPSCAPALVAASNPVVVSPHVLEPCWDRDAVGEIVAGAELEIGDAKAERDRALQGERSCKRALSHSRLTPWIAGTTSGVIGTVLGFTIGVLVEDSAHAK